MAGGGLLAAAKAFAAGDCSAGAQLAADLRAAAGSGKENAGTAGKQLRDVALQALKAAQQRLTEPGGGGGEAAAVGHAALAVLAAASPAPPASQLVSWRYNFARRLVAAKEFADAHAEASLLFQQLSGDTAAGGTAEAANLAVGTALTLVLCCVEGGLLGDAGAVAGMARAAEGLPPWLSLLKPEEAARHCEAAHKYLFKAAVALLEAASWHSLATVCGGMLAAAGSDSVAQCRAVQAVGKLAGHAPEERAAEVLAAVVERACAAADLSSSAALDLLGLLCSTAQRATAPTSSGQLRKAAMACAASNHLLLQTAALLLPALALQAPAGAADDWVQPVSVEVARLASCISQLEQQLQQPAAAVQQQLTTLEAAFLPANVLRRALAGQLGRGDKGGSGGDVASALCSAAAVHVAASVLELLAGAVGLASSVAGSSSSLSSQGHAAAMGLVAAARLRAAGSGGDVQLLSGEAVRQLLGWSLASYCDGSSDAPPASSVVELQELCWLASALFNVGIDLHGSERYVEAIAVMQAALAAAAVGLRPLAGSEEQDAAPRLSDFCRKCVALSDAQQRAGDPAAALASLGHCTALLLQLGFVDPSAWQPMVQAFVRLQAELPAAVRQPAAAAAAQPAKRGRGAASKKAAVAPAPPGGSGSTAAADLLLVECLQQHASQLPEGSAAAVAEQELQCWAAREHSGDIESLRRLVERLLHDVFPLAEAPVEHARVLLALQQLGLAADDAPSGTQLLEQAAAVLGKASGPGAAAMLARVRCMLAVDAGRQLACQALLEQHQERQRSHAAASTSAVSSLEQDAAALGQLADSSQADAASWRRVYQLAQEAVAVVLAARGGVADSQVQSACDELAWLLGLHGSAADAAQLWPLLPASSAPAGGDALAACVFLDAPGSSADAPSAAEAAVTEGGRSSDAALKRSALHSAAAEALAAAGDMVPALYHASEAHRLLAVLFHGDDGGSSGASSSSGGSAGWWRLMAAYLSCLLHLGQLFEAAGLADEALHALREGQRLAVAAGARPLAALCAAHLACIYTKQGQLQAAEQAMSCAKQQLAGLEPTTLPARYCAAAVQLARAQLGSSSCGGGSPEAARLACQAAVDSCSELEAAAPAGSPQHAWCSSLHAAALLLAAEAAAQRDDTAAAVQHASDALAAVQGSTCSAARHQRASALLFLGRHAAPAAAAEQHLAVWGLGQAVACSADAHEPPAAKGRGRKAPTKQPAACSRSKAATAAAVDEDSGSGPGAAEQHLWHALALGRGQLGTHRAAAAALAEACGRQGHLHLAAWLLHTSLGAAMRLQYQLVLYSRQQQAVQRQRRGAAVAGDQVAQLQQLEEVMATLQPGLDWQLVASLVGVGAASAPPAPARCRRGAAAKPAAVDPAAALAALEQQAQQQLHAWQEALPPGTAACSVSVLPSSGGGSLLISRLAPATGGAAPTPLLVALPVHQLSASLSQHPIRALRMDDEASPGAASSSVQSVLDELQAVLTDSGRSMRELSTDTKEQQRDWWRARVSLDDRLAALVKHLDSSWLGPWRCLLLGDPAEGGAGAQAGAAAAARLEELLEEAGLPAAPQQAAVLQAAAGALARHAASGGMSVGELRQAVHQLCCSAGLASTQAQLHQLEALLSTAPAAAAQQEQQAVDADMADAPLAAKPKGRRAAGSVKFADAEAEVAPAQQEQQLAAAAPDARPTGGRKPAAARGRRAAAADAAAAEPPGSDASPVATLGSLEGDAAEEAPHMVAQGSLCEVFDDLSLEGPAPSTAAAAGTATARAAGGATTVRGGKHRSRLRMMQACTPGPATARRPLAAATAPRPARELPLTAAKTVPAAPRPSSGEASAAASATAGPVLIVLDGALQALPWESAAGLLRQRLYRMPSLACAAASAQRASTSVDLASTFYALNPSGDLAATQATFQDWFSGMRGWQGKAGSAPTPAELAVALTSRQLFLYCGHGGGQQYISAARLRALDRCSAALLMGCSSGQLRAQAAYEPSGGVLAYLLAGCPAAVANLWDVTDKDIDRFSQAVLTSWISGAGARGGADVCAAVGASRGACKLPHLVGAAPVCYGIPARILYSSEA